MSIESTGEPLQKDDYMPKLMNLVAITVTSFALASCSASTSTNDSATVTPSVTTSAESGAPNGSNEAWVRGTHVTLTNTAQNSVEVQMQSGVYDNPPAAQYTTLAPGASASETDEWTTTGTDVFVRIKYPDDKVVELVLYNFSIGTPTAELRDGLNDGEFDPSDAGYQEHSFAENSDWTTTINGHALKISRTGDDDDNKNWTVSVT